MAWTTKPSVNPPNFKSGMWEEVVEQVDNLSDDIDNLRLYARKASDETVTSSTTLQDDNELTLSVQSSTIYEVRCMLRYTAGGLGSANGFKFAFAGPSGSTMEWFAGCKTDADTGAAAAGWWVYRSISDNIFAAGSGATELCAVPYGFFYTSSTSGTFKLQWAQNTSSVTGTVVKAASWMLLRKIGTT